MNEHSIMTIKCKEIKTLQRTQLAYQKPAAALRNYELSFYWWEQGLLIEEKLNWTKPVTLPIILDLFTWKDGLVWTGRSHQTLEQTAFLSFVISCWSIDGWYFLLNPGIFIFGEYDVNLSNPNLQKAPG